MSGLAVDFAGVTDKQLLGQVVDVRNARQAYRGSLSNLLASDVCLTTSRLHAAKELVRRALAEELKVRPAFTSPSAVKDYLKLSIGLREHEVFMVLFLDAQHALIAAEEMFRGTLSQTSVYPREVVKTALRFNAGSVILAHNHPSGLAEPSRADEHLTQVLKTALALVDVRVLDHIVVARDTTVSMAERGLL